MCMVPNRGGETIKDVIKMYVHEGTTVNTDEWRAYINAVNEINGEHNVVNHSERFVAEDVTHTNLIENFLGVFKRFLRVNNYNYGTKDNIYEYMAEFMFRKHHGGNMSIGDWFLIAREFLSN